MALQQLDVIVRVAGATLLLVAVVVRSRRPGQANPAYFAGLALCLCGFLAGNTPDAALQLSGGAGRAGVLLSGVAAVALWWFCLSVFDWTFQPRGAVLLVGLAWIAVACVDRGVFGQAMAGRGLSWLLIAMGLGMIAHLAWRLDRDRSGDLIDQRRRARAMVVALLAGQLLADIGADLIMGMDWRPEAFTIGQNAALLAFAGWLLHLEGRFDTGIAPAGQGAGERLTPPPGGGEVSGLEARLRRLIDVEKVHLDPSLDVATFVRMMGASDRAVRLLINRQLGYDHFRTFLNAQRMTEVRRLLSDPTRRGEKLIVIAMESGFASLASFNRTFQLFENTSPTAFRQAALARTEIAIEQDRAQAGI